jgi:esterase/lipase
MKELEKEIPEEPTAYLMLLEEECPKCNESDKKLGLRCQFHELIFEAKENERNKIISIIDKRIEELENKIKQAKEQLEFREIPYPHVVLKGHEDSTGSSEFVEEFITEKQIRIKELQSLKKEVKHD